MIATLEELQEYTGMVAQEDAAMPSIYLAAAQDVVVSYLGYNPEQATYVERLSGSGLRRQRLGSKPIGDIQTVSIDGEEVLLADLYVNEEFLCFIDSSRTFPRGDENVVVEFTAGYVTDELPGIIKLCVLRIAALMATEADGNIGITSKSFGDSGTRTFIQNTKYERYLEPLNRYRISRL